MINIVELVAGRVGEKIFFPDQERTGGARFAEAHAFASIICSSPAAVEALLCWAEAEAAALIRARPTAVMLLANALVDQGTVDGEQVDEIIIKATAIEMLTAEHARRREMQARAERAAKFNEMTAKAP
jgi:hypothetical protein